MTVSVEQLVTIYIKIRDAKKKLTKEYKLSDEKLKSDLRQVEAAILGMAQEAGVTGFTINGIGTTYTKEEMHVSISSDPEFYAFIKESQDFEFLTRRISLKHTREWMKLHGGQLPPGLKKYGELRMRIRGPGADPDEDDDE